VRSLQRWKRKRDHPLAPERVSRSSGRVAVRVSGGIMRRLLVIILTTVAVFGPVGRVQGKPMSEGEPPFWFDVQPMGPAAADRTLRIGIECGGYDGTGVMGKVRVMLPAGIERVAGGTAMTVDMGSSHRPYTLIVRLVGNGAHVIRATMRVDLGRGIRDEAECELPIRVSPESVVVGRGRVVREERVQNGQRFRYGGSFMVPIDEAGFATELEIWTKGSRPAAVDAPPATCAECAAGDSVRWVLFVDPAGKLRDARPLDDDGGDAPRIKATRAALQRWTFESATIGGRTVVDWMIATVPVGK